MNENNDTVGNCALKYSLLMRCLYFLSGLYYLEKFQAHRKMEGKAQTPRMSRPPHQNDALTTVHEST